MHLWKFKTWCVFEQSMVFYQLIVILAFMNLTFRLYFFIATQVFQVALLIWTALTGLQ